VTALRAASVRKLHGLSVDDVLDGAGAGYDRTFNRSGEE